MRTLVLLVSVLLMLGLMIAPVAAHNLEVNPPGSEPKHGWVGGGPLPDSADGQGLMPGGPDGEFNQPPSHGKGLNTACENQRRHGNSAADMWGPPFDGSCNHGGPPPAG